MLVYRVDIDGVGLDKIFVVESGEIEGVENYGRNVARLIIHVDVERKIGHFLR